MKEQNNKETKEQESLLRPKAGALSVLSYPPSRLAQIG
jgi:hypothetical protein